MERLPVLELGHAAEGFGIARHARAAEAAVRDRERRAARRSAICPRSVEVRPGLQARGPNDGWHRPTQTAEGRGRRTVTAAYRRAECGAAQAEHGVPVVERAGRERRRAV